MVAAPVVVWKAAQVADVFEEVIEEASANSRRKTTVTRECLGNTPPANLARAGETSEKYAPIVIDEALMKWARAIARGVRKYYNFGAGSQEEQDLEAVAYLTLARLVPIFDHERVPDGGSALGQFKGWCHPSIRAECQREARRLRNGGTYWCRNEKGRERVVVEGLPSRMGDDGHEYIDIEDYRGREDEDPEE